MSELLSNQIADDQFKTIRPDQTAEKVLTGREAETLEFISKPGIAATIWQRKPAREFQSWVDGIPADQLPELRTVVPVGLAESAVHAACDIKTLPAGSERSMLAGDVAALAYIYGQIMSVNNVQIRLDVDDEVMCPKFHIDNVSSRLLCTYRGPATQYISETEHNNGSRVSQMTIGAVGLFRGRQWQSDEECKLLHRSPDSSEGSQTRLLLVIDPAE